MFIAHYIFGVENEVPIAVKFSCIKGCLYNNYEVSFDILTLRARSFFSLFFFFWFDLPFHFLSEIVNHLLQISTIFLPFYLTEYSFERRCTTDLKVWKSNRYLTFILHTIHVKDDCIHQSHYKNRFSKVSSFDNKCSLWYFLKVLIENWRFSSMIKSKILDLWNPNML